MKNIKTFLNKQRLYRGAFLIAIIGSLLIFSWLYPNRIRLSENGVPSMKTLYPKAAEVALEWQEDAYLVNIWYFVKDDQEDMRVLYGFRSYRESAGLSVRIILTSNGVEISSSVHDTQTEKKTPINIEEVSLDSIEAVSFISQNEGDDFYRKYPNGLIVLIMLDTIPDYPSPLWIVHYLDLDSISGWQLRMNAITNEFIEPIKTEW